MSSDRSDWRIAEGMVHTGKTRKKCFLFNYFSNHIGSYCVIFHVGRLLRYAFKGTDFRDIRTGIR